MQQLPEEFTALFNTHMAYTRQRVEFWLQHDMHSWQWYALLAMLIIPYIIWWKLVDRKRLLPIVTIGLMVMTTANWMDQVGSELGWWTYAYKTIPVFPQMIPVNYAMLPVGYMLLYQWFVPWRRYVIAATVMSAIMTWISEPVVHWMGIYYLLSWKYSYSFPIYIVIACTHKWIVDACISVGKSSKRK